MCALSWSLGSRFFMWLNIDRHVSLSTILDSSSEESADGSRSEVWLQSLESDTSENALGVRTFWTRIDWNFLSGVVSELNPQMAFARLGFWFWLFQLRRPNNWFWSIFEASGRGPFFSLLGVLWIGWRGFLASEGVGGAFLTSSTFLGATSLGLPTPRI